MQALGYTACAIKVSMYAGARLQRTVRYLRKAEKAACSSTAEAHVWFQ